MSVLSAVQMAFGRVGVCGPSVRSPADQDYSLGSATAFNQFLTDRSVKAIEWRLKAVNCRGAKVMCNANVMYCISPSLADKPTKKQR